MYYNKVKFLYNDGTAVTKYCNQPVFSDGSDIKGCIDPNNGEYYEFQDIPKNYNKKARGTAQETECREDNIKRAKDNVYMIARQNHWDYFVTLTFDPKKIDSFNPTSIGTKLNNWLKNRVRSDGLAYLAVPEYHQSGRIHVHLLTNDKLKLEESGTRIYHGKPYKETTLARRGIKYSELPKVYNLSRWKYGYTTAIKTYGGDNNVRLANYVTKYMSKSLSNILGKYYYSSRNICRTYKNIEYGNVTTDEFEKIALKEYIPQGTTLRYKYDGIGKLTKQLPQENIDYTALEAIPDDTIINN